VKNRDPVPERLKDYAERVWARPSVARFASLERPSSAKLLGPF
jgi:hypothetical protein